MAVAPHNSPDISNHMIETFARRVYVPVTMAGVGVVAILITSLVMRVVLSLLFFHTGVPSWANALTTGLWVGGGWGVMALPFLYVVLISVYGYAQRKEIDLTEHPVVCMTAFAKLVYNAIRRVTLYVVTATVDSVCDTTTSLRGGWSHLPTQAVTQRETRGRPPRLRLGCPGTTKEAGHVRLSMRTYTVAVTTAGGTWA